MAKIIVYDDAGERKEILNIDFPQLQSVLDPLPNHNKLSIAIQEPNFEAIEIGEYFKLGASQTPTCPAGQHWDSTLNKCVPDIIPPQGDLLWDSNRDGKWNDGTRRILTTKEGNQKPDDKSIFCAASGSPELIIDGDGTAHLHAGSGGVDNLSIRLRSRHQGECNNQTLDPTQRFGGHGWAIDSSGGVDFKTEDYHNVHSNAHTFSSGVSVGTAWHHVKQTCIGNKTTFAVDGKHVGEVTVTDKGDTSLIPKNSYIWLRLNNSAHGRIYIMAINVDSTLEFDFAMEPVKSSIAFKNVTLTKS